MNGNGYPYPMRSFPSSRPAMMENMHSGMGTYHDDLDQGQSLDQASPHCALGHLFRTDGGQIVSQNDKAENIRRRSMPVYANNARAPQVDMSSPESRRLSMLTFGDPGTSDDFQFDMQAAGMEDMMRNNPSFPRAAADMPHSRNPANDLALNTQYQGHNSPFPTIAAPGSAYASPLHANGQLDMDMSPYPNPMSMAMDMDMDDSLTMMSSDINMFPNNQFNTPIMDSPVNQEFIGPMPAPNQDGNASGRPSDHFKRPSMSNTPEARSGASGRPSRTSSQEQTSTRSQSRPHSEQHSSSKSSNLPTQMSLTSLKNQQPIALDPAQDLSEEKMRQAAGNYKNSWTPPAGGFPSTMHSNPHMKTQFKNAYSSTGFDMLGVLMRVASRPDPEIDIGSVDLSCAFVVCDAEMDDIPIVYCSENFERLTGYTRHMILGRNCRFLQSPDGKVEAGIKRRYVDDDSVLYLKNMITTRAEAQISLINYRRGGQPFMNLLTMIPIAWEPGGPMKFFVGFQVDLVEQPGAMTNKNTGKHLCI
jgi:PAS domain-containing protein